MLEDVLGKWGAEEVKAMDVYSDMFHLGEGLIQRKGEGSREYKANPIGYWRNGGAPHGHYRVLFEDDFEECLQEMQRADFSIINGVTYFGRKNLQAHASKMYALIFDLDGVTDETLNAFLHGAFSADAYPIPNYIVLSGHGVHLYYVFEDPVPLFPNIKIQLKELKYALTDRIWNGYTSTLKTKQRQGINQGFRVIGGKTKPGAPLKKVSAFRINTIPYSLKALSRYVPEAMQVDEKKLFRESKLTLAQAKEKYPEWYEKVVVNKDKSKDRWRIEEKVHGPNPYALYDWWMRQIHEGAAYTHRYFCVMCLAIYAAKCGVDYERLQNDAYGLKQFLNDLSPEHPFTDADIESALECYDLRYVTFPRHDIAMVSGIQIKENKRNGRPQEMHMRIMSSIRDTIYPDGSWRNKNGRPAGSGTKERLVLEYIAEHPEDSALEIARALGISRTTVYKYISMPAHVRAEKIGQPVEDEYERMRRERMEKYMEKLGNLKI